MKAYVSLCNVLGTGVLTILPGVYTYPRALDSHLVHITIYSQIPIPSCLATTFRADIFASKVFGKREASLFVGHNPHERGTTRQHQLTFSYHPWFISQVREHVSALSFYWFIRHQQETNTKPEYPAEWPSHCVTFVYASVLRRRSGKCLKAAITPLRHLYPIARTFWESLLSIRYKALQNFNVMTPEILYPLFPF